MAKNTFTASITKEGDFYAASCVEIGTVSQGDTPEEALANLKGATDLYLEEFPKTEVQPRFLAFFTTEIYG